MRINQEFARALSGRLAENAVQIERAALEKKLKALGQRVLDHIYGGRRELIESLDEPWARRESKASFHFRDGKEYASLNFEFDEPHMLPISAWNGAPIDLTDHPDLMADVMEVSSIWRSIHSRGHSLQWELEKNIKKARTVKKLIELWPEAAGIINEVAARHYDHFDVEVPLDAIFRRHAVAAIAAPAEVIEVAA